jgi:hypothetical protein
MESRLVPRNNGQANTVFPPPEEKAEDTEEDEDKIVAGASLCRAISEDPNLSPLFEAAASDAEYGAVRKALLEERLPKLLPPTHPARAYSSVWPGRTCLSMTTG